MTAEEILALVERYVDARMEDFEAASHQQAEVDAAYEPLESAIRAVCEERDAAVEALKPFAAVAWALNHFSDADLILPGTAFGPYGRDFRRAAEVVERSKLRLP
jgi:hypothetical protein